MKYFKMAVGLFAMLMIGGAAFKFGSTWNTWEWSIAGTVFVVLVLSMIAHKEALAFIGALPGLFSKIPFIAKKDDVQSSKDGEEK